jgi:hypothetical protein
MWSRVVRRHHTLRFIDLDGGANVGVMLYNRDLLDLLSAHAASAIFAARLYAAKERKVKSLQSLVELARGETP